jgi:hypothetical protein
MLRAFEHQMLEQVREPRASGLFVFRTDVVPDVYGHDWHVVIFVDDDVEAVGEGSLGKGKGRRGHSRIVSRPAILTDQHGRI